MKIKIEDEKIMLVHETIVLRYVITAVTFIALGYFLAVFKVSNDCIEKGHTNIGKGFNCGVRFGDTIKEIEE